MKKSFVFLVLLVLTAAGTAAAQSAETSNTTASTQVGRAQPLPDQVADRLTTRLTRELGLTPEQTAKVRAITLTNSQEMMALRQKANGGNRRGLVQDMKSLKEKSDAQYQAVLSPEQFTKFQKLQAERQQMRRERMQQAGGQAGFGDL